MMKRYICMLLAALMLMTMVCASALAAGETTCDYYELLQNGINGKKQTNNVTKGAAGSATNNVTQLSRTLHTSDPVVMKVRYAANGNAVSDQLNVRMVASYSMGYTKNEKGIVGKQYYLRMQNTTGSEPVYVTGKFTP